MMYSTIEKAIENVRKGKMLIIDDPARENEADLYIAAEAATARAIATMIREGGGILCVAITRAQAAQLDLPLMVSKEANTEKTDVRFTVSVNARRGITTGVSAHDRARTIRVLASLRSRANDLTRPGHVFGLIARDGGLRERQGHTEAAVDLARLAGRAPAGVLCEIIGKSGRMARRAELLQLARRLGIEVISMRDLVLYLRAHPLPLLPKQPDVVRLASAVLPTTYGAFKIIAYRSLSDDREHAALMRGTPTEGALVRVHSQCITGDTFFSLRCDCGEQLEESLRRIEKHGAGVVIYLSQEGRGIGFTNKIRAYAMQDRGLDTVEANRRLGFQVDARTYEAAAHILEDLGIHSVRLLTNNPKKERGLARHGIRVIKTIPLEGKPNPLNIHYLKTKKRRLGHRFTVV
ncbi:GTP cyclohydrolase II [Candidatus Kaiserbacteria bacterium]|nr:GTP cyclohydrolase II [Candidatus Kaiserbacteria bacterium]